MNLELQEGAVKDLKQLEEAERQWLIDRFEELEESPLSSEKAKLIRVSGRELFRYKLREDGRGGRDYRIVYDIDGKTIRVIAVFHRDAGYDREVIGKRL